MIWRVSNKQKRPPVGADSSLLLDFYQILEPSPHQLRDQKQQFAWDWWRREGINGTARKPPNFFPLKALEMIAPNLAGMQYVASGASFKTIFVGEIIGHSYSHRLLGSKHTSWPTNVIYLTESCFLHRTPVLHQSSGENAVVNDILALPYLMDTPPQEAPANYVDTVLLVFA